MSTIFEIIKYFMPLVYAMALFIIAGLIFYFEREFVGHLAKHRIKEQVVIGTVFGFCVIFANECGSINVGGALINTRDAGPLIAGLLFGGPAGIIAGVIGAIERWASVYWNGSEYTKVACSIACICAGVLAYLYKKFVLNNDRPNPPSGFFLAIVTEVIHMLLVFITHPDDVNGAFTVLKLCTIPIIASTAISVLITLFIINLYSKKVAREKFGKVIHYNTITVVLQKRIFYLLTLAFFIALVFKGTLLRNATLADCETSIKVTMNDAVNAFIKNKKNIDLITLGDIATDFHVGESGGVLITDKEFNVYPYIIDGSTLVKKTLVVEDKNNTEEGKIFRATLDGEKVFCVYDDIESEKVIGYCPKEEALSYIRLVLYITSYVYVIIFAILFMLLYALINMMVVNNINKINDTLEKISAGNLDNEVNVREYKEFNFLSNGINKMLASIKKLFNEAQKRMADELEFAKKIQYSALPRNFSKYTDETAFDIYAKMDPAKEVGGDFYDFYRIGENKLVYLIADVSGKGIPGAMFMMKSKGILKTYIEIEDDFEKVISLANKELCDNNDAEMFVTAFICVIDLSTGKVEYVNAGHNPPILIRKDGKVEYFNCKANFVLAGMEGATYKKNEFILEKGDAIFLYTDGVPEAINKNEEQYGETRLLNAVKNNHLETMEDLCNNIGKDLNAFVDGADQFDDITMLGFRYKGEE